MKEESRKRISEAKKGNKNPSWVEGLPVNLSEDTEKDLAYLTGYWMGDGLRTAKYVGFAVRDNKIYIANIVSRVSRILEQNVKYKYSGDGSCTLHFYAETKNLRDRIAKELITKTTIRKNPWHFLCGFLDSDGWISRSSSDSATRKDLRGCVQIAWGNTNFDFISILTEILDDNFLPYKVILSYKGEEHKKPCWGVYVRGIAGQYVFANKILPITIDKKKEKLCRGLLDYYEREYLDKKLNICETFTSIQGEGRNTGRIQFFIRASTCSMHCKICDSKYSWKRGKQIKLRDLIDLAERSGKKEVCLTGGEIAQFRNKMMALVAFLRSRDFYLVLQTNGLHYNPAFELIHTVSMDIKTPSTGEKSNEELIYKLKPKDEIKTLIHDEKDYRYAMRINRKVLSSGCFHVLQPLNLVGEDNISSLIDKYRWICELVMKDTGWKNIRVIPQMHVFIWGNKRGV